jgi:collagenase-like PrtC family protease
MLVIDLPNLHGTATRREYTHRQTDRHTHRHTDTQTQAGRQAADVSYKREQVEERSCCVCTHRDVRARKAEGVTRVLVDCANATCTVSVSPSHFLMRDCTSGTRHK